MAVPLVAVGLAVAAGFVAKACGGGKEEDEKPPEDLISKDPPVCTGEKTYDGFQLKRCENSRRLFWTQSDCYIPAEKELSTYHIVKGFNCNPEKFVLEWGPYDYADMCTSYNSGMLNSDESKELCRAAHLFANWEFLAEYSKYANKPCLANSSGELDMMIKLAKGDIDFTRCYEWIFEGGKSVYYCSRPTWAFEHICFEGATERTPGGDDYMEYIVGGDGKLYGMLMCDLPPHNPDCEDDTNCKYNPKCTDDPYCKNPDSPCNKDLPVASAGTLHGCPNKSENSCLIFKKIRIAAGTGISAPMNIVTSTKTWNFQVDFEPFWPEMALAER